MSAYDVARNLQPYSEGNAEIGCTVYPTRRVHAIQTTPRQLWMWNVARIEWWNPADSGTSWDVVNRRLVVLKGR